MNPLSALIGGGMSLIGSWMNSSSQQAINSQNLQAAQYINTGQNLPAYYQNLFQTADTYGINRLAMLGQRGPDAGFSAGAPQPGAGLEAAGRAVAAVDPRADELAELQIRKANIDIANARTAGTNAAIEGAVNSWVRERLEREPSLIPPGWSQPTLSGTGMEAVSRLFRLGDNPPLSTSSGTPIDVLTRGFGPGSMWTGGMPSWLGSVGQ